MIACFSKTQVATVLLIASLTAACKPSTPLQRESPGHPVDGVLELRHSMVLEQPDTALIGQVTGLAVGPNGDILVADLIQSNVKRHDSTGQLLQVLGRQGDGPGEFRFPRLPRFARDGRTFVGEGRGLIHEFSLGGTALRTFHPSGLSFLLGLELLPDNGFLAMGGTGGKFALVRYDSAGESPRILFERAQQSVPVSDEPESPRWMGLNLRFFTLRGDTAFVVASLSDILWKVDVNTGGPAADVMAFEGLTPPTLPSSFPPGGEYGWTKAFYTAARPLASREMIAIPFIRGFPQDNDGRAALIWTDATGWLAIRNAPAIVAVAGDALVACDIGDSGEVRLSYFRVVRAEGGVASESTHSMRN